MERRQVVRQLQLVRAVIRAERRYGRLSTETLTRAAEIVDQTAATFPASLDPELEELLADVRREIAQG